MRRATQPVRWLVAGAVAVVIAGVGVIAWLQLAAPPSSGGQESASGPCTPKPCLDVQNYTLWISNVTTSAGVVRMQVRFRNASGSTHASPEDLQLVDSKHQAWPSVQDAPGCTHWDRKEFQNGATFGPITVCFRPSTTASPLSLSWSPDFGLFCCQADVRID